MAAPQPSISFPREISSHQVQLSTKPGASIHYSFALGNAKRHAHQLVVFLNGLMSDKASWIAVMAGIIRQRPLSGFPSMLAYDRYGQGMTEDRDPQDKGQEPGHGHDVADAASDLHQMLSQVVEEQVQASLPKVQIIFVANSIGCAIARLYAQKYPGTVPAFLFLDSIMANSNFDFWPNPDEEGFSDRDLPVDVTVEVLRQQRRKFATIFAPEVANREGLNRRNLAKLLPYSDRPKLVGPGGNRPLVTVVGHDFVYFAEDSFKVSAS